MNARRSWLRWLVVLAVLVLLAAAWWIIRRPATGVVKLPDGRELSIAKITFGTQHRYAIGGGPFRLAASRLPDSWRRRLGMQILSHNSPAPSLVCWVQWRDPTLTNRQPSAASIGDDAGLESEPVWCFTVGQVRPGTRMVGWAFDNFPPRAPVVGLKILDYQGSPTPRIVAGFRASNPAYHRTDAWTALPCPLTNRADDVSCVLANWTSGRTERSRYAPYGPQHANWNVALFQVTQPGLPPNAWQVASLQATGAAGNRCDVRALTCAPLGDYLCVEFSGALWGSSQAWKLNVELSRASGFTADELWSCKSVPAPWALGASYGTNLSIAVQGVQVRGLELVKAPLPIPAIRPLSPPTVVAKLHTAFLPEDTRVTLVSATDNRGQPVLQHPAVRNPFGPQTFDLNLSPEAVSVDFAFAIHRSRRVEFVSRPVAAAQRQENATAGNPGKAH